MTHLRVCTAKEGEAFLVGIVRGELLLLTAEASLAFRVFIACLRRSMTERRGDVGAKCRALRLCVFREKCCRSCFL